MTINDVDNSYEHVDDDEGDDFTMATMITTTKDTFSKHGVSFVHTSVIYIALVLRFLAQTVTYFCLSFSLV